MTLPVASLFRWACRLDVATRKAGNVSRASPGHGMSAALFEASADAAAVPLCEAGASVGARIEAAVQASLAVAQCNTNLGIVLLCAPLAAAAQALGDAAASTASLHAALQRQLLQLDVNDSVAAYRAIAAAQPGGLGDAEAQDVRQRPGVGLRAAMCLAAGRDSIAREYAEGFPLVFGPGLAAFLDRSPGHGSACGAMLHCYLALLASVPDSHIVRKRGDALAHSVMAEAQPWLARLRAGAVLDADPAYAAWDTSLKARGINPGTSADLSVASAFTAALVDPATRRSTLQALC